MLHSAVEIRENFTSLQPLGPVNVLVCYSLLPDNEILAEGILIEGEFLSSSYFAPEVVENWEALISKERKS